MGGFFAIFVVIVGPNEFISNASQLSPARFSVMLAVNGAVTVATGIALYLIARNVGLGFSPVESVFLNTTAELAHNLTPFGQAGGIPVSGAILSRRTDRPYEECLAALSAKDIVGFVPAIVIFVFGGGYLTAFDRSIPAAFRRYIAAFAVVVTLGVTVGVLVYRYQAAAFRRISRIIAWINRIVARLPRGSSLDEQEVQARIENFSDSVESVASDPPTVVAASAMTTAAVTAQGILLWLTLTGVGVSITPVVTVFIIPISLLASALPLPGGSGGVEALQTILTVAATGAPGATVLTAVVVSRGLVYWTPIVLGSMTFITMEIREQTA
ncbi:MAG: putative integral membrane protein [halophilic archaeon J07HX5]|nr:MAG: putative integral membrane protein [halophilic archaeon J07HX5]